MIIIVIRDSEKAQVDETTQLTDAIPLTNKLRKILHTLL